MMISIKTNARKSAKLPVPVPAHPELSAARTMPDLPDALDRKKHPEMTPHPATKKGAAPGSLNAAAEAASKPAGKLSALAAQIKDPARRAAVEKIEAEKAARKATKRAVRKEVRKAKESGATAAMPLSGKAAQAALKAARKATAAPDGKAKVRAAAKKVVAEVKAKTEARSSLYDWAAAEMKAKAGTVPPAPKFSSYGPHLQKCHDMAKAGQAKELREYLSGFTSDPCPPSRKNLFRYGNLCLAALKAANGK